MKKLTKIGELIRDRLKQNQAMILGQEDAQRRGVVPEYKGYLEGE
jgi:hypothetical protein